MQVADSGIWRRRTCPELPLFAVKIGTSPTTLSTLKLIVQLTGAGWADATVSDGRNELTTDISYISDGIAEMAAAARALLQGAQTARFAFQHEPGEHVFVLTRGSGDSVKIEIFENQRNFECKLGAPVMTISCAVLDFVGQVFSSLHALRIDEGYKDRWRHEFPLDSYEFIQRVI
jgi:hypothetical protein